MMAKLRVSLAEGLICFYSFVLGILRFSVISFSYYFCTTTLRMAPTNAIICCHSNMASMYLSETLTGTVSKTKLGVPRTAVVLSSILVFSFVFPLLWGDSLWKVCPIGVSLLIFVTALLGGLIHCLKHVFINEYELPEDQNRFLTMKFVVVELEYVGKTVGGFLAMGTIRDEPSITFTGICWMCFGILQLLIALAGLKCFQKQKDNRNIIKEFIKHSCYAMKRQLTNRRNESELFSADDEERIKIVHSVLPLYVPVIMLIGLKDLKYSRYTWQTTQLTWYVFDESYNPQKILMFYPLTVVFCLPVYHFGMQPLLKKLMTVKLRTTTRAIVSFYFMAASLAFATVLDCRIEAYTFITYLLNFLREGWFRGLVIEFLVKLDHQIVNVNKSMRMVDVYNFLPCTAQLETNYAETVRYEVPSVNMITVRCPIHYDYHAVLFKGSCEINNVSRLFSMTVVLKRQQDVRIATGFDLRHAEKKKLPIFFRHLHHRNQEAPQHSTLWIVFNIARDHILKIVPTKKSEKGWVPAGGGVFEENLKYTSHIAHVDIVQDGWYAIVIDNNMIEQIKYKSQNSYAIMISQNDAKNDTVVKVITVHKKPSRHVFYQLPQVISSALAEMMIEAPGFVYGRKKVPLQWNEFVTVVWTFCSFLGNAIIIIGGSIIRIERNLTAFLIGSACSIVAIALISVFLLDYYKADYVEE